MDKVRAFLRATWKQRFWVLTVIAPLVAAICWMSASGKLQEEFKANKGTIEGHFSDMSLISNEPIHGNDAVNQKEMEEAVKISKSVRALWQELYDSQREQVLFWPKALGEDFVSYIEKKKFQSAITITMRRRYLDYIKTQFDALLKIVDAQKLEEAGMSGVLGAEGMPAPMSPELGGVAGMPGMTRNYLVDWLDQGALRTNLSFGGREPTSLQIWVAQEDLWVYETLLGVIARTNKARGATRGAENAAIRVITELQVGAKAALAMNQKGNVVAPAAAEGMDPMAMSPEGAVMMDPMGMDGTAGASVDATLLVNRYIGPDGKPIGDATAGLGIEYRRLPIRMVLTMDQRWVPKVLVECANAALPIEVQRLRINPEQSGAGYSGSIGAAAGGGGPEGLVGGRGFMGSPSMYSGSSAAATPLPPGIAADYATVEIQGLVYIYNEPSAEQLLVPGAEEPAAGEVPADGVPADGAPAPETPAVGEEVASVGTPAVG